MLKRLLLAGTMALVAGIPEPLLNVLGPVLSESAVPILEAHGRHKALYRNPSTEAEREHNRRASEWNAQHEQECLSQGPHYVHNRRSCVSTHTSAQGGAPGTGSEGGPDQNEGIGCNLSPHSPGCLMGPPIESIIWVRLYDPGE